MKILVILLLTATVANCSQDLATFCYTDYYCNDPTTSGTVEYNTHNKDYGLDMAISGTECKWDYNINEKYGKCVTFADDCSFLAYARGKYELYGDDHCGNLVNDTSYPCRVSLYNDFINYYDIHFYPLAEKNKKMLGGECAIDTNMIGQCFEVENKLVNCSYVKTFNVTGF